MQAAHTARYTAPPAPPRPPQPPAPKSPRLNVIIAWIVITLSVLKIFGGYFVESRAPRTDVSDPRSTPDARLELSSRYAVGAFHLLKNASPQSAATVDAARSANVAQVDKAARTTVDRLRVVPVVAELQGKEVALDRLRKLRGDLHDASLEHDALLLQTIYEHGAGALTSSDRQELIAHHGWFGRLALAWNAAPTDAQAQTVYSQAARTFIAGVSVFVIAGVTLLAGLVLFVMAMVLMADGRIRLGYARAERPTVPFLEAFAVYVGSYVLLPLLLGRMLSHGTGVNWTAFALQLAVTLFAMFWPLLRGVPKLAWRRGLGWHVGRGLFREIGLGLVGYIAGMPIVVAGMVITLILVTYTGADSTHPIINFARGGMRHAWPLYLLASVYAPLVEETLFRGALFHHLRGRHGWWVSALLVSVIFAAMHPQGWAALPALGSIAIVFAAIREWRGTVFASAGAHALHNGILVTLLILSLS